MYGVTAPPQYKGGAYYILGYEKRIPSGPFQYTIIRFRDLYATK